MVAKRRGRSVKRKRGRKIGKRKYMDIVGASVSHDTVKVITTRGKVKTYKLKPKGHYVQVKRKRK